MINKSSWARYRCRWSRWRGEILCTRRLCRAIRSRRRVTRLTGRSIWGWDRAKMWVRKRGLLARKLVFIGLSQNWRGVLLFLTQTTPFSWWTPSMPKLSKDRPQTVKSSTQACHSKITSPLIKKKKSTPPASSAPDRAKNSMCARVMRNHSSRRWRRKRLLRHSLAHSMANKERFSITHRR